MSQAQFGRYHVERELGSGGMGLVLQARDRELDRAVAIKVVRHGGDEQLATRLLREARSLARVSHPNVCHVYDVGREGNDVWFAMELIDGVTLRQWAVGRPQDELLAAMVAAGHGLVAAHAAGLVHRDVKPENVMVDRAGRAVVTDFGLVRFVEHSSPALAPTQLTQTGAVFGTPAYMAPEQIVGDVVDARADQFAWAAMVWELLIGRSPFPRDLTQRFAAILGGLTQPAELPAALGAALVRALAADPSDRFASMADLLAAIEAPPVQAPTHRRRFAARSGLAALAVVAVAGLAVTWRASAQRPAQAALAMPPRSAAAVEPPPPSPARLTTTTPAPSADPLPAGYERATPTSPVDRIDPDVEWANARVRALQLYPDARVSELQATNVTMAGTVDLTTGGLVTATFGSRSAHKRAAPSWGFQVAFQSTGGYGTQLSGSGDSVTIERLAPWPRCTLHDIVRRASTKRTLPAGGVATIQYLRDHRRIRWLFRMGSLDLEFADDCVTPVL